MATSNTKFSIKTGLQLLFLVLVFRSFFDDIATVTKESEANEHSIEKSFSPNREMVYNKSTTAKNHVCFGCQPKTLPTDIWKRVNGRKLQKTEKIIMNCFLKKKNSSFKKKWHENASSFKSNLKMTLYDTIHPIEKNRSLGKASFSARISESHYESKLSI